MTRGKLGVVVRIATEADGAELARLNAAFNDVYEPPETVCARLTDPGQVEIALIAKDGARGVGFAGLRVVPALFYKAPSAELTELYVEPAARRQGVGRRLVALALEIARDRGARELRVLTSPDNEAGRALYRSMGFKENDISMTKTITPDEA